jgi:hypothetical protein
LSEWGTNNTFSCFFMPMRGSALFNGGGS